MNRLFALCAIALLACGCASTFYMKGAENLPPEKCATLLYDENINIWKVDGDMGPIVAKGPFAAEVYTYYLTPGTHTIALWFESTSGISGSTIYVKRSEPIEIKQDFNAGTRYKVHYNVVGNKIELTILEAAKK